jgi:hypothetical protein
MKHQRLTLYSIVSYLAIAAVLLLPLRAAAVPGYDVEHVGNGTVAAINNLGDIAANEAVSVGGQSLNRGWVSTNGGAPIYLPLPAGMNQSAVADVNDYGLAVGSASGEDSVQHAVAWYPEGAEGYRIVDISSILGPDSTYSQLVAVNNHGVMVGTSVEPVSGLLTTARSFAYSEVGGLVRISNFPGHPTDINDENQIVADNLRLDLDTNLVEDLGLPEVPNISGSHFIDMDLVAINNYGSVIGRGVLATSLNNNAAIAKYTDTAGWEVLTIGNIYPAAFDINNREDVTYAAAYTCLSSVVRFEGEGTYCVSSLLVDQGWTVTNGATKVNDNRQMAASASNNALGIGGVVRLVPAGDLPLPSAPENLTATLQPPTSASPNGTIRVEWTNPNTVSVTIEVERKPGQNGELDFAPVYLSGNGTDGIFYPLELDTTYTYRARACGLTGCSDYSNEASATTSSIAADTTPPEVTFVSPQNGDQVSGDVQIAVTAVDDVAMQYIRISFAPVNGDSVICTAYQTEAANCSWSTIGLQPGTYALSAQGVDHLNNYSITSISVEVIDAATDEPVDTGNNGNKGGNKGNKGNKDNTSGGGKGGKK